MLERRRRSRLSQWTFECVNHLVSLPRNLQAHEGGNIEGAKIDYSDACGRRMDPFLCSHYLQAVIEKEECDVFTAVTWLVTQGNGFDSINQNAMGGQQVGLQRGHVSVFNKTFRCMK